MIDTRRFIATSDAPGAIGPYSQAVVAGEYVYTAGQIALDPATGTIVGPDITTQTRQVLRNLAAILDAAGSGVDRVVKTTVFLKDMNDFAAMNEEYGKVFTAPAPARSTVEVARLPRDVRVEIEAIAIVRH